MPKSTKKTEVKPEDSQTLSQCYLEHAARETVWMKHHAKGCDYAAANNACERRNAFLTAALIAQGRKL